MASITVVRVGPNDKTLRDFLVEKGGVFFSEPLMRLGGAESWSLAFLDENGRPMGGLNLARVKLRGFSTLSQPMYHPHCSMFLTPLPGGMVAQQSRQKKVLETLINHLSMASERTICLPFPPEWTDLQPFIWKGYRCTVKYTYRIQCQGANAPEEGFEGTLKGHIRKAKDSGIEVVASASREALMAVWNETANDQGFAVNEHAIDALFEAVEKGGAQLRVAKYEERTIGFAFTVFDEHRCYYLLGGLSRSTKIRGALPTLLTDAIASYRQTGGEVFDFEGSMMPGVERFFRSFGGDLTPYFVVAKAPLVMRQLLRFKGRTEF
jgi:hypothetical protein